MSKVDWSLAPEGATHYGVVSIGRICWYMVKSDCRYDFAYQNDGYHAEKWTPSDGTPGHQPLIARPQPKPWSGPQDGLPPVGSRVEIVAEADEYAPDWDRYADHIGKTVTIIAHQEAKHSQPIAVYSCGDDGQYEYHSLIAKCFRPIKTPDQLAAEQRETAIREIMDIADVDCRVTAARLVDAGFKREVV